MEAKNQNFAESPAGRLLRLVPTSMAFESRASIIHTHSLSQQGDIWPRKCYCCTSFAPLVQNQNLLFLTHLLLWYFLAFIRPKSTKDLSYVDKKCCLHGHTPLMGGGS